jgi:hypothetical protein
MKTPAVALAAAVLLAGPAAGRARSENFHRCNRIQWGGLDTYIDGDRNMARSTQGDGAPDTAYWDSLSTIAVRKAWRGWWELDSSNQRIAVYANETRDQGFNSLPDSVNVIHKYTSFPGTGPSRIVWWPAVFAPIITEFDIALRGRTTLHTTPIAPAIGAQTRCAHNRVTMAGSLMHELGHGYGYEHWLDWISIMNPGHRDALSCERAVTATSIMDVTPDALSTRCHDIAYGLDDGFDLSGTPVRQTCALGNGVGCSSVLSSLRHVPVDASFALVLVTFTTFSNRDAVAGDVGYRLVLSTDAVVSTNDREVGRGMLGDWGRGATVTRILGGRIDDPTLDLPLVGVEYRVLVQLDPSNLVAETNESNNVIDTDMRFVRH